jgi:hypothetical protein
VKFKLLSDLHLEFYKQKQGRAGLPDQPIWKPTPNDEDKNTILLLAGDIHVGRRGKDWIDEMTERFKEVVYIAGNHEFYHQVYENVLDYWQNQYYGDAYFLHNKGIYFDDVRIFGATLWTEVTDPFMQWTAKQRMADYQIIRKKDRGVGAERKINVMDTNTIHKETIMKMIGFLNEPWDGKTIILTHHMPHEACVHPRFEGGQLNDFFRTDLDWLLKAYDIDVWCHGHTHDNVDTHVHGTRILCNPMGYHGVALNSHFNEDLVFNV